jgi:hypothetical protein
MYDTHNMQNISEDFHGNSQKSLSHQLPKAKRAQFPAFDPNVCAEIFCRLPSENRWISPVMVRSHYFHKLKFDLYSIIHIHTYAYIRTKLFLSISGRKKLGPSSPSDVSFLLTPLAKAYKFPRTSGE